MYDVPDLFGSLQCPPIRLRELAYSQPAATAITSIDTGASLTWSGLYELSLRWAGAFDRMGVGRGDSVATILHQSLNSSAVWLGVVYSGGLEFPINPEYSGDWLVHTLTTSQASVVVVTAACAGTLRGVLDKTPLVTTVVVVEGDPSVPLPGAPGVAFVHGEEFIADAGTSEDVFQPGLHDLGCAVFTSGTTGASKAVAMPWGQLATFPSVMPSLEMLQRQVYFVPFRPFHLSGKGAFLRPVISGTRSVIREKLSISSFWDDLRTHGATWAWIVPLLGHALQQMPVRDDDLDNPLEIALVGPSFSFLDELKERFGFEAYSSYGLTETSNFFYLPPHRATSANYRSCGVPAPGIQAIVVDEIDRERPQGESGELIVRSDQPWLLNQGYIGKPEASFEAWRNGWFHTGDKFRINDEGEYEFLDRMKDALRKRGENVSSLELEEAILKHPAVKECAVVAVPAEEGEDEIMLVAVVDDATIGTARAVIDDVATRVPSFAVPRYTRFVDSLPRTQATDRVQKHLLRAAGITDDTWDRFAVTAEATVPSA